LHKVRIKPLSVNEAWQGKRYKTPANAAYGKQLWLMLPPKVEIPGGKLKIKFVFGLSMKRADYDNCIKQAQDVICKKYNFDDSRIYKAEIEKVIVPKGEEFLSFSIEGFTQLGEVA